jgi:hypothetical protein
MVHYFELYFQTLPGDQKSRQKPWCSFMCMDVGMHTQSMKISSDRAGTEKKADSQAEGHSMVCAQELGVPWRLSVCV